MSCWTLLIIGHIVIRDIRRVWTTIVAQIILAFVAKPASVLTSKQVSTHVAAILSLSIAEERIAERMVVVAAADVARFGGGHQLCSSLQRPRIGQLGNASQAYLEAALSTPQQPSLRHIGLSAEGATVAQGRRQLGRVEHRVLVGTFKGWTDSTGCTNVV
jgi:hypothetical protein